ncbi:hypothetical protein QGM71_21290 [Virgibacillus sp. C22-A2]|uniref:Helix-turn-helix domain of resolvase n=1 Tax=Virgibacillus tibetensis TaxID=3042313 RepID=A0ABU6KLF3_9BACI|nr:hypothetical protein [Virgibacillus sp. C22-A2]
MGRPSRPKADLDRTIKLYMDRKNNQMSVNDILRLTGVPRATIYHKTRERNEI